MIESQLYSVVDDVETEDKSDSLLELVRFGVLGITTLGGSSSGSVSECASLSE
jgi:hypothetical protein